MSVATSTALTIGAIAAGAGTSIYGATKAAGAQKDAAQTQAASADKALAIQKQMYEQQRTDLSPYRAAGQGAVGKLSYQLGVPGFEKGPMAQMAPTPVAGSVGFGTGGTPGAVAVNGQNAPIAQQAAGALTPYLTNGPQMPQPPQAPGATVMLRAPNGMTKAVPQEQAPYFISKGAQPVQGGV